MKLIDFLNQCQVWNLSKNDGQGKYTELVYINLVGCNGLRVLNSNFVF